MISLLVIAGIPTTVAVAQGINAKPEKKEEDDPTRMNKFTLEVFCDGKSSIEQSLQGRSVVLHGGKVSGRLHCPAADVTSKPDLTDDEVAVLARKSHSRSG